MAELREACDYLLIPFNAEIIKCQNLSELLHEVSNDGSREKFTSHFMEEIILPKILECARRGKQVISSLVRHLIIFLLLIMLLVRNKTSHRKLLWTISFHLVFKVSLSESVLTI